MTIPEYILLGAVIAGAIIGYFKGFLKQIVSLLGIVLGYFIARIFLAQTHLFFIEKGILSDTSSIWVSFILTFLLVLLSIKFISGLLENFLKSIGLGFTNQWAGMVLGAAKYFFIIMLLFCFLSSLGFLTEVNTSQNLLDFISLFKTVLLSYI